MGFKTWRNLSALALASVALIGCNTGQKDNSVKAPPPNTQTNQNLPGFATNNANNVQSPFPTAQPKSPFLPASGTSSPSQFGPPPGPGASNPFGAPTGPSNLPGVAAGSAEQHAAVQSEIVLQ